MVDAEAKVKSADMIGFKAATPKVAENFSNPSLTAPSLITLSMQCFSLKKCDVKC